MPPDPLEPYAKLVFIACALIVTWSMLEVLIPILCALADALRWGVVNLWELATPAAAPPVKLQARQPAFASPLPVPEPKKKRRRKKPRKAPPRPGLRVQKLDGGYSPVTGRVHLDECASSYPLKGLLEAHGFSVTMTHEVGLLKASDRKQLNHAIKNRATIVTYDGDFLDFHAAGERHSGIVHSPSYPTPGAWHQEILRVLLFAAAEATEEVEI